MTTPAPYPTPGNGIADSWDCSTDAVTSVQSCVVTHWAIASPAPVATYTTAGTAEPAATPYPEGYSPGDTGNWQDIGPWFGALITAAVIGPFALMTFMRYLRDAFR